jgi:hypothetical protein
MRVSLITLSELKHVILVTMHHIISDAWSVDLLIRELVVSYEAFCGGTEPVLPELPVQYAHYAIWQREWLQGELLEAQLSYWKQHLSNPPETLALPLDRPRLAEPTYNGALFVFDLTEPLKQKLNDLSRHEESTVFMTLLAAYKVMLNFCSGQEDILVGTHVANRNRVELENLIGLFTNTVVLRTDLSGDPNFIEVLARVREGALAAYAHQEVPFNKLVEALKPMRGPKAPPLFNVSFNLLETPRAHSLERPGQGLKLSPLPVDAGMAPFDLILSIRDTREGWQGLFSYNTDLFNDTTVAKMSSDYETILQVVVGRPEIKLSDLQALLAEESKQQFFTRAGEFKNRRFQNLKNGDRRTMDLLTPIA